MTRAGTTHLTVRAVIWDVGGTLVDWRDSPDASLREAFADCGLDPRLITDQIVAQARAAWLADEPTWRTDADECAGCLRHARALLAGSGVGEAQIERLGQRLRDYYDAYAPVPGVPALLEDLARRGVRQGVVSNWPPSLTAFLAHHGLTRHFDVIACSGERGMLKPQPDLFAWALQALGVEARDAVYIGNDPVADMQPARALGMGAIHFDPRRQHAHADARTAAALRGALQRVLAQRGWS